MGGDNRMTRVQMSMSEVYQDKTHVAVGTFCSTCDVGVWSQEINWSLPAIYYLYCNLYLL